MKKWAFRSKRPRSCDNAKLSNVNFLSKDEKEKFLIGSPISVDKLTELSNSNIREIRHLVASNLNVSRELLIKLSHDAVIGVRQEVANSNRANERVLEELINDESTLVRTAAIRNSNWTSSSLDKMYLHGVEPIDLAKNPSISRETLIKIIDQKNMFSSAEAASNIRITPDIGFRLLELDSKLVNNELCKNASSGKEVLRILTQNKVKRVSECAKKTLANIEHER